MWGWEYGLNPTDEVVWFLYVKSVKSVSAWKVWFFCIFAHLI